MGHDGGGNRSASRNVNYLQSWQNEWDDDDAELNITIPTIYHEATSPCNIF